MSSRATSICVRWFFCSVHHLSGNFYLAGTFDVPACSEDEPCGTPVPRSDSPYVNVSAQGMHLSIWLEALTLMRSAGFDRARRRYLMLLCKLDRACVRADAWSHATKCVLSQRHTEGGGGEHCDVGSN